MIERRAFEVSRVAAALLPVMLASCTSTRAAELHPEVAQHAGREILDVDFGGGAPFGEDTLQAMVASRPTHCSLLGIPLCLPFGDIGRDEHRLSPEVVRQDVNRLVLFYRREGYFGTSANPAIEMLGDGVRITFNIRRADAVIVDALTITGTEGILDQDSLARAVPLQPGEIFHLGGFAASADTIVRALHDRGYAYAELLRNFTVDTVRDRAEVHFEAIPGPRVVVDSILVPGAEHLGRRVALRQLAFRTGDLLRLSQLVESQRNLYLLDLVQFASVAIAPDSLQADADSSTATVLVRIAEAPVHEIDAAVGWGSIECFHGETRWANRSFGGGARSLVVSGAASKLGIGLGLGSSLCSAFEQDTFATAVDYRIGAELEQPYFIGPRNTLALNVYSERISEPTVFQRAAVGARLTISRRLTTRTVLTSAFDVERGTTIASEVLFCGAFQVCDPETIERLTQPRFRNTIGATVLRDRSDQPLDPTHGYIVRTGVAWAPPWLLSDVTFVRWTGEGSVYRTLRPGWVGAASLRFGNFFQTASVGSADDFLPPEDRFYAGGASSARGFDRNALGPGVWVTDQVATDPETGATRRDPVTGEALPDTSAAIFSPSGGTSLLVVNAEARLPSPFLSNLVRLAVFVDAGAVGTGDLWDASASDVKFTPGAGIRMQTPVGPVRIDLAYNPHGQLEGPLFFANPETGDLDRIRDAFRPARGSFLSHFRLHLAVGQAF